MTLCFVCIGAAKTGSSLCWDALRLATQAKYVKADARLIKMHYSDPLKGTGILEELMEMPLNESLDRWFSIFVDHFQSPKSSWHGRNQGVHYLSKASGFNNTGDYLRSGRCIFITSRRNLLDRELSMFVHFARQSKISELPEKIDFDLVRARSIVEGYSRYHLSLFEGLDRLGIQSKAVSSSLALRYDEFYIAPSLIIKHIGQAISIPVDFPNNNTNEFDRSLSFDEMRSKHDKSGSGLRNIQYDGDPGYYYRGKPGGGVDKFTPQSWEFLRRALIESVSARRLFEEYGFEEVSPDTYVLQ